VLDTRKCDFIIDVKLNLHSQYSSADDEATLLLSCFDFQASHVALTRKFSCESHFLAKVTCAKLLLQETVRCVIGLSEQGSANC